LTHDERAERRAAARPARVPSGDRPEYPPDEGMAMTRPAYQKYDVAVRKSGIDGFGAFAAEPIPAHRKIGEIRGESISVSA